MTYMGSGGGEPHRRRSNGTRRQNGVEHLSAEQAAKRIDPKARRNGKGWSARCPVHDDEDPSLSVSDKADGGLLVCCHANCSQDDLIAAFESRGIAVKATRAAKKPSTSGNIASLVRRGWTLVKASPYSDEDGVLLYENVRLEIRVDGQRFKTFKQRRPVEGGGYVENLKGVRRVPYRLAELVQTTEQDVHLPEGEKDADSLAALGLCASSIAAPSTTDPRAVS
jgi:putative DNA primase/helicase